MNTLEKKVDALIALFLCENPTEKETILNSLREMTKESEVPASVNYTDKVRATLLELGTPDRVLGHKYLIDAIVMVIENPDYIKQITSILYPDVAKKYNTTASRVERAIRHAIEITWDRGDVDVLTKYFGNTISITKGKPTNGEFLARIANELRD